MVNKDFLKEVLAEHKKLLRKSEVNYIAVPHYDELSVKKIYPQMQKDPDFTKYFPDKYPKDKGPPREFSSTC